MHWILEHPIIVGLIAALLFELLTIILRFGFKMTSPTHTRPIARVTRGFRVHHGYPGIGLLAAVPIMPMPALLVSFVLIVGIMLFLSDLIHHAVVLPIFAGHHEFDIKYPGHP
ncbi:MAG: hypothetical protein KC996_01440 [Phycisphaerales bacterium]|nr:hypothetical protein [Phycisphaerales bacterium]